MDFKFVNTKITLEEGIAPEKFLANRAVAKNPEQIKSLFLEHGYDISNVPGEFIKTLSFDDKEAYELSEVLDEIDALGLKDVFNANLRPASFRRSFLERVKYCLDNHIPFLNSDNTFIATLRNDDLAPAVEQNIEPIVSAPAPEDASSLDAEDLEVKSSIIKTLSEINEKASEPMLTFIISSIISNLDMAINKSAKEYRTLGLRSIITNALVGVTLTPEMQDLIDHEILSAFPLEEERGL